MVGGLLIRTGEPLGAWMAENRWVNHRAHGNVGSSVGEIIKLCEMLGDVGGIVYFCGEFYNKA